MKSIIIVVVLVIALIAGLSEAADEPGLSVDRVQELIEAIESDPNDRAKVVELGNHFFDRGEWTAAQRWYMRALEIEPEDPNVLTDLATTQRNLGEPLLSLETLAEAIEVDPSHWQALYNKSLVLIYDLDKKQDALEVLDTLEIMRADLPDIPELRQLRVAAQPPAEESPKLVLPALEEAARKLVRTQIPAEMLEELYQQAAQTMAIMIENQIQPTIERVVSDSERSRLIVFCYNAIKDLMPYSVLEDIVFPILARHFTVDDLNSINDFLATPVGQKLASAQAMIAREGQSAGEQLGRKMGDSSWGDNMALEFKKQFPQWFPESD